MLYPKTHKNISVALKKVKLAAKTVKIWIVPRITLNTIEK